MNTVSISHTKFKELKELELSKNISNMEATLYKIKDKNRWENQEKVIKKFKDDSGYSFGNKLLTINSLVNQKDSINIDEIVMPEKLVVTGGKIIGFTMDYIDNYNMKDLFLNPKIDNRVILNYLKEIGEILEKIRKANEYGKVKNFHLNDIHEANFIIDKKTNHVRVIDIDSCKIGDNVPFTSKYLTPFSQVALLPEKYKIAETSRPLGYIEPDMNSDLYCYSIMILNYLYKGNILTLDISEFYTYLNYLRSINFPSELLDCFSKLYNYCDNTNPKDLLDLIPNDMGRAHNKVYSLIQKQGNF